MVQEGIELRREISTHLRALDRLLGLSVPVVVAIGTLTFVESQQWVAMTAPFAHAAISFYAVDAYTEMAYLGGNRRYIEEELSRHLRGAALDEDGWHSPMVWESIIVPDRLYSAARLGLSIIWLFVGFIALVFGTVSAWAVLWEAKNPISSDPVAAVETASPWTEAWGKPVVVILAIILLTLYVFIVLSFNWMRKAHDRAHAACRGIDPGPAPVPFGRFWPKGAYEPETLAPPRK